MGDKKEDKACPFCGSDEWYFVDHQEGCYLYKMHMADEEDADYGKDEMMESWNTRPALAGDKELLEKLVKVTAENKLFHKNISKASADFLRQKIVIDGFWEALHNSYNVESREEIEKECKESWAEGISPLAVALHFVWKREPKVKELVEALEKIEGIAEMLEFKDLVDDPCDATDKVNDIETVAIEALKKYKEQS